MPPPRLLRSLVIAVALGAAVALGLAATASLPATIEALARFRWALAPMVLLAVLVNWALRFAKWHFYLGCLDIPLPWRPSLRVFLAGFTMAISPGKLGEVLKAVLVRDLIGTHVSRIASVVMAERLTDVAGLVGLAALGVTALPRGPLLLLAIGLASGRRRGGPQNGGRGTPGRRLLPARLVEPAPTVRRRRTRAPGNARPGGAIALSVVSWFFECLAFSLILEGLGVDLAAPCRDRALRVRLARRRGVHAAGRPGSGGGQPHGAPGRPGDAAPRSRGCDTPRAERHALARRRARGCHAPRHVSGCGRHPPPARVAGSSAPRATSPRHAAPALRPARRGCYPRALWRLPRRPGTASTSSDG